MISQGLQCVADGGMGGCGRFSHLQLQHKLRKVLGDKEGQSGGVTQELNTGGIYRYSTGYERGGSYLTLVCVFITKISVEKQNLFSVRFLA